MDKKQALSIIVRYSILLIIGLNLAFHDSFLYRIFTPLTVYPAYAILNLLYGAVLISPSVIFIKGYYAQIIPACIAGSAYFLLLILVLATQLKWKTYIKAILFCLPLFLFFNILRIVFFSTLLFKGSQYFDAAHSFTWYFGSTLLVVLIWFLAVLTFSIREIPFYSDAKSLINKKND